ncbi:capsular polysaccharide biosynthesis protein [Salinicola avicenniae]|uniref:capsular polysaccharide biosynthesis protein n=1 Tax=Salinicola avicenniae TaxID=2916836 RepID=UPI0020746677|nr:MULTISPECIES: capsular polysaccharide biosynthesis protein [unclassified Salinicola]
MISQRSALTHMPITPTPAMTTPSTMTAAYLSMGLSRWHGLKALLPEFHRLLYLHGRLGRQVDAVLGWGLKPSGVKAHRYAQRHHLPYVALEDGFLRSLQLGIAKAQPHSMIVDFSGIYYDAGRASDLEQTIWRADFSAEELKRARDGLRQIRELRLSKYNHAPDRSLSRGDRERILVVDQTCGDASVTLGRANAATFQAMLATACREHPHAEILVKTHPDVIAGRRRGYLANVAAEHPRIRLITEDINPWALFDQVDVVHVVTSQLGFEALMAGKPVHCHGMPFYAGWGLTQDRQTCERRGVPRDLLQLFAATYLRYSRYANPITGQPSTLEATIDLIADQKRQRDRLSGHWVAHGFSRWKRGFLGDFLGPDAQLAHVTREPRETDDTTGAKRPNASPEGSVAAPMAHEAVNPATIPPRLLVWGRLCPTAWRGHERLWRAEDGFLRSVGLGVDLTRPCSLALDATGVHYAGRRPSDLETLLATTEFSRRLLQRAANLRRRLVAEGLSKYNVDRHSGQQDLTRLEVLKRRHVPLILVTGQVETDASITSNPTEIRTNHQLLANVRQANPHAVVIYKPHPDVVSGARLGTLPPEARRLYDIELPCTDIALLLERVDALHTISSLSGFEALLRGVEVHTYGMPFYAGWGLTHDRCRFPRRRPLTLDALVAGSLILYPVYVAPGSRQLCNAETIVDLLTRQARTIQPSIATRCYRVYRRIWEGSH